MPCLLYIPFTRACLPGADDWVSAVSAVASVWASDGCIEGAGVTFMPELGMPHIIEHLTNFVYINPCFISLAVIVLLRFTKSS